MVSVAAPVATIKWVKPAPIWDLQDPDMLKPFLAEFDGDRFLPDFLDLMGGKVPDKTPANLSDHAVALTPDGKRKLYQPLHGNYYLVTGSLVCRQFGLPDRTVARKNGEKVSFVVRRMVPLPPVPGQAQQYLEQAWVKDDKSWHQLLDDQSNPVPLLKNEERLPMHPVKVCVPTQSATGTKPIACDQRTVYHGYIPVDSREKYLAPAQQGDLQQAITDSGGDFRLDEFQARILEAWRAMYVFVDYTAKPPAEQNLPTSVFPSPSIDIQRQISLNVIVDTGDFLSKYLPGVYSAILNQTNLPASSTKRQALLDELNGISVDTNVPSLSGKMLSDAIRYLRNPTNLAHAESGPPPQDLYNLYDATAENGAVAVHASQAPYLAPPPSPQPLKMPPAAGNFYNRFADALAEEGTANTNLLNVLDEIGDMIKQELAGGDFYVLRLLYEHNPCDPVVSAPSDPFTFAKIFDPDAPARHIRIELPSIKLKDLRKYKRGVGMQMSPELGDVVNKVNPGMLNGGGLLDTGSQLGIAMICSFSIPIITLCALIVMFIFLILLNIIFWWLPFIRICFPVPKPK